MAHTTRRALFRADASATIGGGHVMRCLTLAKTLREKGWDCHFASIDGTADIVPEEAFGQFQSHTLSLDQADDPGALPSGPWDLLVIDHYGLNSAYERRARDKARRLLVIDDLADRPHDCDILLDQNLGRTAQDYRDLVPSGADILTGPDYALLRPGFACARNRRLAELNRSVKRLLIFVGLGDPNGVLLKILDSLPKICSDLFVDIVIGRASGQNASVERRVSALGDRAKLYTVVDDMAALMGEADIAIGAAGSTSWERCCLCLPTVLITIADNQRSGARALCSAGAAELVGNSEHVGADDIAAALNRLLGDSGHRQSMAKAAGRICDGLGARRVAQRVFPPTAKDGGEITLRPATSEDGELMLDWQSAPTTRKYFRNPEPPARETHFRWVADKLDDPFCTFGIVEHDREPAGIVRLDRHTDGTLEVSVLTAPGYERLGIARTGLCLAGDLVPKHLLFAEVLPGNDAAQHLFRTAGYRQVAPGRFERPPLEEAA